MKFKVIFEINCNNSEALRHALDVCLQAIINDKLKIRNWELKTKILEESE